MRWSKRFRAVLIMTAACAFAPFAASPTRDASAQDAPLTRAQARALFDEALALEAAGDYASALEKLQKAATYKRTPQIRYNIALCYEKLGRLVQALGEYRIALADAEADSASTKVAKEIRRAIESLEPRIPTIAIARGENSVGARVTLDGKELSTSAMADAIAVDPGTHVVEAQMAGFKPFRQEVKVEAGAHEKVEVALEQSKEPAAAQPTTPPPADDDTRGKPPINTTPAHESSGMSTTTMAGWILTGVGVASLGASGYFLSQRSKAISDLEAVCGADKQSCPASSKETYDKGKRDTLLANVTLGAGAASLITGVVLIISGNASSSESPGPWISKSVRVTTSPPGTLAGLGVDGHF